MDTSMWETALFQAIQEFDSMQQFSEKLGVPRENVSAWLNKNIQIPVEYAFRIEGLTQGKISWKTLLPPHTVRLLKHISISVGPVMSYPCVQIDVSLHRIQHSEHNTLLTLKKPSPAPEISLGLDENNRIIFGEALFYYYRALNKKTIPAWRFSLSDLLAGKYKPEEFLQILSIDERAAMGIALKKRLGNRQGERSDLKLRRNFDEVSGRTDEALASLLGFSCKDSYRQAEKIHLLGSDALKKKVNAGKLSISTGAQVTCFPHKKQQEILVLNKKEMLIFIQQYKKTEKIKS